jgi:hypothetical protein
MQTKTPPDDPHHQLLRLALDWLEWANRRHLQLID